MNGGLWRLGGAALMTGSVVLAATDLMLRFTGGADGGDPTNPVHVTGHAVGMLAGLLLVVGLPAMVAALGRQAPILSAAGFVLLTLAFLVYEIALGVIDTVVLPYLVANHVQAHQPGAMFLFFIGGGFAEIIGNVLIGIAIVRIGVFTRISGILLIAAGAILLVTLAPLPEWVDSISELAMLAGLAVIGGQLVGIRGGVASSQTARTAATAA